MKQPVTPLVLAALKEHRWLTRAAICDVTGLPATKVAAALNTLLQPRMRPAGPRRVRIAAWTDEHATDRKYLRPVYGLGRSEDARKPDVAERRRAAKRASYHRCRGNRPPVTIPAAPTTVFDLAHFV